MKTDQREVLTREKIEKALLAAIKSAIVTNTVFAVLVGIMLAIMALGITKVSLPYLVGGIVAMALLAFLVIYFWYNLIKNLILYNRRKYTVAEDRVLRIAEDEVRYLSMKERLLRMRKFRRVEENAIYFRDAGRVVVTDKSICCATFVNDLYYIVKYDGQENVELMYSQKEYRLEDEK